MQALGEHIKRAGSRARFGAFRVVAVLLAAVLACSLLPAQALARTAGAGLGIALEVPAAAFVDPGDGSDVRAVDALVGIRVEVPSQALVGSGDEPGVQAADSLVGIRLEVPTQSYVDPGDGEDVRATEGLMGIRLEVPSSVFVDPDPDDPASDVRAAEGTFGIRIEVPSAAFVEPDDGADVRATDALFGIRLRVPSQAYVEDDPATTATASLMGIRLAVSSTHTVTFDANGGVGTTFQTVLDGAVVDEPDPVSATREGYVVDGWYTDPACGEDARYDFAKPVFGNFTLYAKWVEGTYEKRDFYLHMMGEGASLADADAGEYVLDESDPADHVYQGTYEVEKGKALPAPARAGYAFTGWYAYEDYAGRVVDCVSRLETETPHFYAKWEKLPPAEGEYWTVTFDTRGGTAVPDQLIEKGSNETAAQPERPRRQGFEFTGWFADNRCRTPYDFSAPVTADTTVYAGWERRSTTELKHTVTFDARGGTKVASQTVRDGGFAQRPAADPTRGGWRFAGWYATPAGADALDEGALFDFASVPISADTTVYAGWREPERFSVTFYAAGGEFADLPGGGVDLGAYSIEVLEGSLVPAGQVPGAEGCAVAAPRQAGWQFSGWYPERADGSGAGLGEGDYEGDPFDFASTPIKDSTALYAKWTLRLDVTVPVSVAFAVDAATGEAAGPGADRYALKSRTVREVEVELLALESRQGELEAFFALAAGEEGGAQPTWEAALAATSLSLAPAGADAIGLPFAGERAGDVWSTLRELGADERASWRLAAFDYGATGATPDDAWSGADPSVRLPLALALSISDGLEAKTDLDGPRPIAHLKVTVSAEA